MKIIDEKQKKPFFKDLNLWFGFVGIVAFLFSVFTYLFPGEPDLKLYMLDNTSILDVKEEVSKLNITYDSINLLQSDMDISIMLMQIKNDGDKNITVNDYDPNIPFGMKLINGKILKKPELISSSENEYYRDVVSSFNENEVFFKYKLIDKDKFFNLKLLVLHRKDVLPSIKAEGKISGVKKIELTNIVKSKDEEVLKSKTRTFMYALIGTFIITIMLIVIRYQRSLLQKANSQIEYLYIVNKQLDESINKNPRNVLEFETPVPEANSVLTFEQMLELKKGDVVYHERFGKGEVIEVTKNKEIKNSTISIKFEVGTKRLLLRFSLLKQIE